MNRRRRRAPVLLPATIAIALAVASLYALDTLAGWLAPLPDRDRTTVQPQPGFGGSTQTLWFLGGGRLADPGVADADTLPSRTCAELARRHVSLTWRCHNLGREGEDSLAALHRLVTRLGDPTVVRPDNVILVEGEDGAAHRHAVLHHVAGQFPHLLGLAGFAWPRAAARAPAPPTATLRTLRDWATGAEVPAIAAMAVPRDSRLTPGDRFFRVINLPPAAADAARLIADQIAPVERF